MAAVCSLPNFLSFLFPSKSTPSLPTSLQLPQTKTISSTPSTSLVTTSPLLPEDKKSDTIEPVVWPSLANANILHFFNVQIKVADDESEEKILQRFRRSVLRAGILQESKRRRHFETNQEKRKRKTRSAAQRNRRRRPELRTPAKDETPKKNKGDDEDDNWEVPEGDIPYVNF